MRRAVQIPLLIIIIAAGLGVLFYPDVSHWWNSRVHAVLVFNYQEELAQMRADHIEDHWRRAHEFNAILSQTAPRDVLRNGAAMAREEYLDILNIGGVMALVEIPAINVNLPVFHTVGHDVLLRGVGHMEISSFPVGGYNTHSVLTAHSGLASHRLFTDLEELDIGQLFFIRVLGETLAYQVDQRRVVLPHQVDDIRIIPDADHVTLVTCTPFAINSHRLLVRGVRVPYEPGIIEQIASILPEENIMLDLRIVIIANVLLFFILALIFSRAVKTVMRHRKLNARALGL